MPDNSPPSDAPPPVPQSVGPFSGRPALTEGLSYAAIAKALSCDAAHVERIVMASPWPPAEFKQPLTPADILESVIDGD